MSTEELEHLIRKAPAARADKLDVAARTVAVVWAAGASVRRRSYEGPFLEELSMEAAHVRLDRLNAGGSVVDSHSAYSVRNRVGTVVPGSARIVGGKGLATIRLSSNEIGETLLRDLEAGHRLQFSCGYKIHQFERREGEGEEVPVIRATDWEPLELSVVLVPADPAAHTRSLEPDMTTRQTISDPPALEPAEAELAERTRATTIVSMSARHDMSQAFVQKHLREGTDLETFRATLLDTLQRQQPAVAAFWDGGHNDSSLDNPEALRNATVDALVAQFRRKPAEGPAAAVFADGEVAFGRRLLRMSGRDDRGMSDERVRSAYQTTSDFVLIGGALANVVINDTYKALASPITQLFGRRVVDDFNVHTQAHTDWTKLFIGRTNEHGEFKSGVLEEGGESMRVFTDGGIVSLTRQLLRNAADAIGNLAVLQGKRLAAYRADQMVAFIEQASHAGPKMRDNNAVFHASRGNIEELATYGQQLTATELMRLRSKQARRKGAGDIMIGSLPKFWVVHPDFEAYAIQSMATVQASALADVNPIAGKLVIVSEPRLQNPTKSWLVNDPSDMDGAVQVYLEGEEEPHTSSQEGFDIDGIKFKIRHDFGLAFLEWRSWTRLDHNSVDPEA